MPRAFKATAWLAVLLLASGCMKSLNHEEKDEVSSSTPKRIVVPAAKGEQKIHVKVTSEDEPVNVFVYLKKDEDAAQQDIFSKKYTSERLKGSARDTKDASFEATVPANEEAVVHVEPSGGKKANVKIKITN